MTGTSMASPAVAGMMALILSRWPDISETDAYQELMKTGVDTLVKCRDGRHYIPYVSFAHAGWETQKEEDDVRQTAKIKGVSAGKKLIVRADANSASSKVGNVQNGDVVIALRTDGAWREVAFAPAKKKACVGWINAKYVEVQ